MHLTPCICFFPSSNLSKLGTDALWAHGFPAPPSAHIGMLLESLNWAFCHQLPFSCSLPRSSNGKTRQVVVPMLLTPKGPTGEDIGKWM